MSNLPEMLVPITLFAGIVLSIYFFLKVRNRERMAMIEKGILKIEDSNSGIKTLKWGLVSVGIAIGLFLGNTVKNLNPAIDEETAYFSMILLFGGLALIAGYIIQIRSKKSKNNG